MAKKKKADLAPELDPATYGGMEPGASNARAVRNEGAPATDAAVRMRGIRGPRTTSGVAATTSDEGETTTATRRPRAAKAAKTAKAKGRRR